MKTIRLRLLFLLIAGVAAMTFSGCGIRYTVQGTVIDMDTHQPVEGAVVSIKWEKEKFSLPGMGRHFTFLELADDVTGPDGKFKIPKYTFRDYHLAAYKKEYVCWENEDIFPDYKKREGFQVENGMTIELEPFRENYSKDQHNRWIVEFVERDNSAIGKQGAFEKALEEENNLYWKRYREEKGGNK